MKADVLAVVVAVVFNNNVFDFVYIRPRNAGSLILHQVLLLYSESLIISHLIRISPKTLF